MVLLFVLFELSLFPQESEKYSPVKDMDKVERKLAGNSMKINSIISDFKQEKHLAYLNDVIISKGKFRFKKENFLRWEYVTPFEYVIIINGDQFIIKDGDSTKEYDIGSNKIFREINKLIISSVKGDLLEKKEFSISIFENAKSYMVKMIPEKQEMKDVLERIELYFNKSDLDIFKVKMIENEKDYTVISFENKKINEAIPPGTFSLD